MKPTPYSRQSINQDDIDAVVEVLRSDWLTQGPKVKEFEEALAHECGAKHCIAVANGTMALHLACLALGVGPGDLGLTSPITFLASANCVLYCGGRVDFADIDPATLCLSPDNVEEYCKTVAIPKVVIPVDFAGVPADLPKFKALSDKYGFKLIEDAAHSLGSTYEYNGRTYACGSCAHTDLAILSFHPVKTITTGEGGAVLTNDDQLADKLRILASHGVVRDSDKFVLRPSSIVLRTSCGASNLQPPTSNCLPYYYEMQLLGFNARITDIQCALGLSQLKRLSRFKQQRQDIVREYNAAFQDLSKGGIVMLPPWPENMDPCYHLYVLRTEPGCRIGRDEFYSGLRDKGINCQVHYIPIYRQPLYRQMSHPDPKRFPHSETYFASCLSLPVYPNLESKVIESITSMILSLV